MPKKRNYQGHSRLGVKMPRPDLTPLSESEVGLIRSWLKQRRDDCDEVAENLRPFMHGEAAVWAKKNFHQYRKMAKTINWLINSLPTGVDNNATAATDSKRFSARSTARRDSGDIGEGGEEGD